MANRPCSTAITCPGPAQTLDGDDPIINFSSEAIDGVNFTALSWPITFFLNPFNPDDPNDPASPCTSPISQADADLCSHRTVIIDHGNNPVNPNHGKQLFGNTPQSCVIQCPDGTPFIWEVPAGTFLAYDVLTANQMAGAYACEQAGKNVFCLFTTALTGCLNQPYLVQVHAAGGVPPYKIQIVAGTPPPLVGFFQSDASNAFFSGQPSAPGTYPVAVQAIDSRGISITRTVLLTVMEISNANAIPAPQNNTPYVFTLQGFGGTPPYTFALVSGTLPNGLQLSAEGVIAGVPFSIGALQPFTVKITDATGASCNQQLAFMSACSFFNTITWPAPVIVLPNVFAPPNSGSVSASFPAGNQLQVSGFTSIVFAADVTSSIEYFTGNTDPKGYSGNCTVRINTAFGGAGGIVQLRIYTQGFAALLLDTNPFQNPTPSTTVDYVISIPPGTTQLMMDLFVNWGTAGTEFAPYASNGTVTFTFGV